MLNITCICRKTVHKATLENVKIFLKRKPVQSNQIFFYNNNLYVNLFVRDMLTSLRKQLVVTDTLYIYCFHNTLIFQKQRHSAIHVVQNFFLTNLVEENENS